MKIPLSLKRLLLEHKLLPLVQKVKYGLFGSPQWISFKPADPGTLVSTLLCFQHLHKRNLLAGTDYFEFGIFRGFNLWYMQALARSQVVPDMRFFGFDSFFGIPEVSGPDLGGPFKEGDFSAYRQEVEVYFNRFGVDWSKTFLVEGFFCDTLNDDTVVNYNLRRCSFCMIDCDLYSSTVEVLAFVAPLLAHTCLIYFDDWQDFGSEQTRGEPRAFVEFLEANKAAFKCEPLEDLLQYGGKGKAFWLFRL